MALEVEESKTMPPVSSKELCAEPEYRDWASQAKESELLVVFIKFPLWR